MSSTIILTLANKINKYYCLYRSHMSVTLIVNNIPFEYPTPGTEPGWGEPATGWAEEATAVLTELLGPSDIAETTFNIQNNISVFTDVAGLKFNTGTVRAAQINYSIYRVSTAAPSGHAEAGIINIIYDNAAAPGSKWQFAMSGIVGTGGLTFNITDLGQVQYKSTDINSVGYSGILHFRAKTLGQ